MDELTPLPPRIQKLATDERGYPVPWFVDWVDGRPEWNAISPRKWARAICEKCCWVCGRPFGTHLDFVIEPICGITRSASEIPCHRDCARWSIVNFSLLLQSPLPRRRDALPPEIQTVSGILLRRNPGVMLEWTCRDYLVTQNGLRNYLIDLGKPSSLDFWLDRRRAEPAEIKISIQAGLLALQQTAQASNGMLNLQQSFDYFCKLVLRYRPDLSAIIFQLTN